VASGPSTPPVFATPSPRHDDPSVYRDTIGSYFGTYAMPVLPGDVCELGEHLGTLNIGPSGSSYFYGATARGEVSVVFITSGFRETPYSRLAPNSLFSAHVPRI
jgi:hypothetical protein